MESKEKEQGCRKHEAGKEGNNLNNPIDKAKEKWQRRFQLDRIKNNSWESEIQHRLNVEIWHFCHWYF